jgi:hypothetical protein
MARNYTALTAAIKSAFTNAYAETSSDEQGKFDTISAALAKAIDDYVELLKTSVDSETLVM